MLLSLSVHLKLWPPFANVENNNKCKPNVQPKQNNLPRLLRSRRRPKLVVDNPPSRVWELVNERRRREAISRRHLLPNYRQAPRSFRWAGCWNYSSIRHRQKGSTLLLQGSKDCSLQTLTRI